MRSSLGSGPNKSIIRRRQILSAINHWVWGGSPYSAEAQAVFDRMNTPLSPTYKAAINTFINTIGPTQWALVKEFWLFANDTQANSLIGWKGVRNATLTGSPSWSASFGFLNNGSSQYINSEFTPSIDAVGCEDNLSVGCFIKENLDTGNDKALFGCSPSGGAGHIGLRQVPSSAGIYIYPNTNSFLSTSEGSNDDRILDSETEYTSVQDAGVAKYYKDGLLINSASRANTGLSTVKLLFGAHLSNVTVVSHINAKLSAGYIIDPTGFDYRAFHLALKTMLTTLGVYASTPELTIPSGGEWFDFNQASVGSFTSLIGRKALLTCSGVNTPTIEAVSGVNMLRTNSTGSKVVDLSSVFQTFYDGTLPSSFSILVAVKPIDGTPSSAEALFGHTNSTSGIMYSRIGTNGKITIGFKEASQAEITTVTDFAAFSDSPSNVSILIFEFLKDEMIVEVNGIRVNQTEASWGTRLLTDFDGGTRNMYLGCENVDGTPTRVFNGHIGDFMIRRGGWSQSQKERLYTYFQ